MQLNYISSFFIDLKVRFFIYSQPDSFFPLLPGQVYEQVEIQLAERKVGTIIGYIKRPGSTERIESSEWLLASFTHKHFRERRRRIRLE